MRVLSHDLRYSFRALLRRPGFTVVAVLTLALGVGASTAIFSVVNGVLLRPLPYPQPERLVQVWETNTKRGWLGDTVSPQNFEDWQAQSRSFETMSAYEYESFVLTGGDAPERLIGIKASSAFMDVLGVRPALGRGFLPGEDARGARRVVVLSDRLWRRHFGGRADALGQSVTLDGEPYTVVGVMPAAFSFPSARRPLHGRGRAPQARLHARRGAGRAGRDRAPPRRPVSGHERQLRREAHPAARGAGRASPTRSARAARRGSLHASDRLRQRRQPSARAGHGAPARDRRARGAGREPPAHRSATPHRKPLAGAGGRGRWTAAERVGR